MNNKSVLFDKGLKYFGISKKQFSHESSIPYDTVTGWKKRNEVPAYAFILLKKIVSDNKLHGIKNIPINRKMEITAKLGKKIQAAFWGKNYTYKDILKEIKQGNPEFVKPFFENLYYQDTLKAIGNKGVKKVFPVIKTLFDERTINFWKTIAEKELDYVK